ncbi:hypothetical protein [Pseudomonas sp. EMN2]|uniref:hypothetical protein n=1 Tax=Pseudomonas sp. EMN2 TaxID=2615212 RepID=UPI00129AD1C2|nr:hypothetical protein [Pseudomonas sp. EMN2]
MTSNETAPMWCIALTFADEENNGFVTLGGAGWESQAEWESQWAALPLSALGDEDPANLIADKLDLAGEIIADKRVTAETVERLLGRPLAELIEKGRANTPFILGQALERDPELAAQFHAAGPTAAN